MPERADFDPVIHRAVARQAAISPDATALNFQGRRTSYRVLHAASSAYAAELAARGVGPGQVVPLLLPRSDMLVTLQLGVLKCGAAYANLDPRWPAERHAAILRQVSPTLVLAAEENHSNALEGYAVWRPAVQDIRSVASGACRFDAPPTDGSWPATVFFTSGTTGGPKGVVSPHQAVTRLFQSAGLPGFGPGHATPQTAPLPWDMYAFELWGQLTSGGTSVLVDGDHLLPSTLRYLVRTADVDTVWLTASLFNVFVDEDPGCFTGLGQLLIGGEKLSPGHVREFLRNHPGIPLRNGYGPAENCMLTTTHLIQPEDCAIPQGVPIGTPVPGTTVLVLDRDDHRCGVGQPGEICIAGSGLATGYLGHPELNAAKFPTVPVDGLPSRIYRTGDIGVIDAAGVLHFAGRQDRQVKISGYRVELAEIELTARGVAGVRDCAAVPLTASDGNVLRLALFYVPVPGSCQLTTEADDPLHVREQLLRLLPGYLVPGIVRGLPRFPVTDNGKLDRKALSQLALIRPASGLPSR
jgi:amino acid adenylation domain-containing protein